MRLPEKDGLICFVEFHTKFIEVVTKKNSLKPCVLNAIVVVISF